MPRPETELPSLTWSGPLVLALVEQAPDASPYDLKKAAEAVAGFCSLSHTQIYAETERLAGQGLLHFEQDQMGRRRRRYRLTRAGREVLGRWRNEPQLESPQLRDFALMKLYAGASPAELSQSEVAAHQSRLDHYRELLASCKEQPRRALVYEALIAHEELWVAWWRSHDLGADASQS